ncbi:MAG: S1 family peptidase [Proteobacteria bacterium]|nr:MAG: S1 family peptidase [Pseudomonadota bacterium]
MRFTLLLLTFGFAFDSVALINGTPLSGSADVVRIKFDNGWACTGVYIDPFTILTAAHCIDSAGAPKPLSVDIIESAGDQALSVSVRALIPHPEYRSQRWPARDIGIIKTSQNVRYEGKFILQDASSKVISEVTLVGCGRSEPDKKILSRLTGTNRSFRVGSVLFFIGESSTVSSAAGMNVSVAPNDSGGPVLDTKTGRVMGVMTTTTVKESINYGLPTLSTGTSTTSDINLRFIRSHLGATKRL